MGEAILIMCDDDNNLKVNFVMGKMENVGDICIGGWGIGKFQVT